MTLHILKNYPATIKIFDNENEIFCVSTTECLSNEINLDIGEIKFLSFKVYPHETKKLLPFSFELNLKNKNYIESKFAKAFQLPQDKIILKLFPITLDKQNFSANVVEITESKLKKLSYLNDVHGRAKVEIYSPNNNELKFEEEYFVYTNKENQKQADEVILLDFFQSLYANDFSKAQEKLTESLLNKFTKDISKKFFGDFNEAILVNYYLNPSVVLLYDNYARVFSAKISSNKISDIYEIN